MDAVLPGQVHGIIVDSFLSVDEPKESTEVLVSEFVEKQELLTKLSSSSRENTLEFPKVNDVSLPKTGD